MTQLLKLFLIFSIALPSAAFGMDLSNDPRFQKIAAANNHGEERDNSGESSLNTSIVVSPRHNDAENLYLANMVAQSIAATNATAANGGIQSAADRFTAHAERITPKAPRLNIKDRGVTKYLQADSNNAVEDNEWGDIDKFNTSFPISTETSSGLPTAQLANSPVGINAIGDPAIEDLAPEAPPFPDNIHIDINNPAQNDPVESPRPPAEPIAPELGHQIPEEYADAPAPAAPAKRPLPFAPITHPTNNSNNVKTVDEEPIIEEIAEPIDEPAEDQESIRAKLTPQQREETDFTTVKEQITGGVREEINRTLQENQRRHAQRNVRFAPQDRVKPFDPRNPAEQVNDKDSIIKPAKAAARTASHTHDQPAKQTLGATPKSTSGLNITNLLISAGIFGMLSWLENYVAKRDSKLLEIVSGAQQAAGANIAQQLLCKKPANTFAFTATFALLHAGEVGLKKLTASVLGKTKAGKRINAAYNKLPKNKRKMIDGIGMLTTWTLKTLLANAITN
jgi:hypothetical protein